MGQGFCAGAALGYLLLGDGKQGSLGARDGAGQAAPTLAQGCGRWSHPHPHPH